MNEWEKIGAKRGFAGERLGVIQASAGICVSRCDSRDKVLGTHLGVGLEGVIDHSLGEVPVQKK